MRHVALGNLLFAAFLVSTLAGGSAAAQSSDGDNHNAPDARTATGPKKSSKKPTSRKAKKPDAAKKEASEADEDKTPSTDKKAAKKSADSAEKNADAKKSAKPGEEKKPEAAAPATYKVKKGPFHIDVTLDGVFESQSMAEMAVRPQEWQQLAVLKAVEHGAAVKQGDFVLALDTDKIDRTITELRAELKLNELAVKEDEAQLAALEKVAPIDSDANQRAERMAKEDYKLYQDVEKPLSVKLNDYRLKAAKENLEYAEEEYRQLEKMYKADDLREETEKIVLKRAKNQVDRAKLQLEFARAQYDEIKKLSLPRQDERAKEQTERALIDVDLTRASIPLAMSKHRLELEKLQIARNQGEDRLKKLLADREAMTLKAPIDGIVYYGRCVRGRWMAMSHETLRRGAPVQPNEIVMTIVQPRPLFIRTTVPESQAQRIRAGLQAYVEPTGFVPQKLTAVVERVGTAPLGLSGFDCHLTVVGDALSSAVVPGTTCELKIIPYKKSDALTVPPKAVFADDLDPSQQYVYLQVKNGKPQKRFVRVGEQNSKQVEILEGLAAGDEILQEKPKEE